jgi:hypothetical protein
MEDCQHIWSEWAKILHHWGVQDIAATLLESRFPLGILGAQVIYFGTPFLKSIVPEDHLIALTEMLENPVSTRVFTAFLRECNGTKHEEMGINHPSN